MRRPFDAPVEHMPLSLFDHPAGAPAASPPDGLDERKLASLGRLIQWGGWPSPVVIGDDGRVVAGDTRIAAMASTDALTVPVVKLSDLDAADWAAFAAADARMAARAGWGRALLAHGQPYPRCRRARAKRPKQTRPSLRLVGNGRPLVAPAMLGALARIG